MYVPEARSMRTCCTWYLYRTKYSQCMYQGVLFIVFAKRHNKQNAEEYPNDDVDDKDK